MSSEELNKTSFVTETSIIDEGALSQKPNLINRINQLNEIKLVNKTKRTCVNALNQRLYNLQKKDKLKKKAIVFTIFFSVGIISYIVG